VRRRAVLAALTAVVLSGGVAACGGGSGSESKTTPPAKAGVNDIAATARDQVKDGGQIVWPIGELPPNFNYNQLDGTLLDNSSVMGGMTVDFFNTDAAGNAIWNKNFLAEEPQLKTDPQQVVTFKINPKVKWSDGAAFTWEDVAAQWKASNGTNKEYKVSSSNGWQDIEKVEKGADDREVVVTFKNKYADWQALFTNMYPKSTNNDPKIFNEGWIEKVLATAGPLKFESIDKTAQTITLVRNDQWWGNKAKLDKIIFKVVEDNATADAPANGEIDFTDIGANVNLYKRAKELSQTKVDIRRAGGPNWRHITINGSQQHLADKNVRQALALAINRDTIAKALLAPLDIQPQALNNHIFMSNHAAYKDNSGDLGKYNLEKAKQMLDTAGWKLSGAVRQKDGKPLAINFVIPAGVQASKQESELVQAMLKEAGVTVNINTVPSGDFFEKYITPGQFDFTVFSWIGTAFPVSSSESIYKKPVKAADGTLDVQQNYSRIGTDEIDALYKQANAELDKKKNQELGNEIDAKVWVEVYSLPMYQRPDLAAVKKEIVNLGAFAYADYVYEDMGYKK
jgi:peptide/nickel transport system substrate-binding protein